MTTPVLIAGAGPTGLVLALALTRRGVAVRIVDEDPWPGDASRAIVVQARTLEFYDQLGITEEAVARGIVLTDVRLREGGREMVAFDLRRLGEGLSPYPFALILPQDDHERFLVEVLEREGVQVERSTRLVRLEQDDGGVRAVLATATGEETCQAAWLVGCDGARSQVRKELGIEFPGGTYDQPFYVADVKIAGGFRTDLAANLGEGGLALMFPVRSSGMQRLIGNLPPDAGDVSRLSFEDVRARAESLLGVTVERVNWFAAYRVHHRVAERFRVRRVFLAGDAGHIHSPAGGQGMNTGIGDAVNLAWRLAEVLAGRASAALLDGYERERIGFARKLVATTDRAFRGMVSAGRLGRFVRTWLAPRAVPRLLRLPAGRRTLFRTVSQIGVSYRDSGDGEGRAGQVHAGDRLPWAAGPDGGNFAALRTADWQAHVYGAASAAVRDQLTGLRLRLVEQPWTREAAEAGLAEDALYLIRPDGHVAFASAEQDAAALARFAAARGLDWR